MLTSRRTFLSTIAASTLLGSKVGAAVQSRNKSLIWIWLGGGISATEFLNPIPNAPSEYRSVTGAIQTNAGYLLGGNFEHLARIGEKLTPVLSFAHKDTTHHSATANVMDGTPSLLGSQPGATQKDPFFGSVISHIYKPYTNSGIPSYIKLNSIEYDSSAWLGQNYTGYEASDENIKSLSLNTEESRFLSRLAFLSKIDRTKSDWINLRDSASDLLNNKIDSAFKLDKEDPRVIDRYNANKNQFAKNILMARRLIECGAKFITLSYNGWDMHADIKRGFDNLSPILDISIYNLIIDLESLSLLQDTLIVITSEFSRTPKLNGGLVGQSDVPGRDHWSNVSPLLLAGGKYISGGLIGTTNSKAEYPTSTIYTPQDLATTIFDHFEIDKSTKIYDNQNRPRFLMEENSKIIS